MGDALLAFFGAPVAHEDDAVRRSRASLELLRAAREFAREARQQHGILFEVRAGLNTGQVVVGEVGSDLKYEYTAIGDAVNLAARMQTAAEPGEILLTEHTYRLAAPFFEFEDRGMVTVKGRSEPVRTYSVSGKRRAATNEVQARGIVGLDSPLAALEQLILSNQALHQAGASEQARAAREASAVLPGQALAPEAAAVLRRLD